MSPPPVVGRASAPRLTYITDTRTVSQQELFARLDRLGALDRASSDRFAVQLRDPELPTDGLVRFARELRSHTRKLGLRFFVNDRVDIASLVDADGVHLGGRSISIEDARSFLGRPGFISIACHSPADVVRAAKSGATACTLSPIFASPGKGSLLGASAIHEARTLLAADGLDIGVVALGGIDDMTAREAIDAGADGVAAIRNEIDPSLIVA